MLTSWKLDPHTVMRLKSGRRGDDVLKGGHLACSSHKPLTSSYSPVTKRLQAGQDQGTRAASSSAAKQVGVPIMDILRTGAWSSERTFARHYSVHIRKKNKFAEAICNT